MLKCFAQVQLYLYFSTSNLNILLSIPAISLSLQFVSRGGKLYTAVKDVVNHTNMIDRLPKFVESAR